MGRKSSVVEFQEDRVCQVGTGWRKLCRKLTNGWRSLRILGQQCPLSLCILPDCCSCDEKHSHIKCFCDSLLRHAACLEKGVTWSEGW